MPRDSETRLLVGQIAQVQLRASVAAAAANAEASQARIVADSALETAEAAVPVTDYTAAIGLPPTDNTHYLGINDDDNPKSWKGLIMKDQGGTGKYYRLEVFDNALRIVDLTD